MVGAAAGEGERFIRPAAALQAAVGAVHEQEKISFDERESKKRGEQAHSIQH